MIPFKRKRKKDAAKQDEMRSALLASAATESEKLVEEQVAAHREAVLAALADIISRTFDSKDPVVALLATTITKSGEINTFRYGAVEANTAYNALEFLRSSVVNYCMTIRGKSSPLKAYSTGVKFEGRDGAKC